MNTQINIINLQDHLVSNTDTLYEALSTVQSEHAWADITIRSFSLNLASGYGTWQTRLTLSCGNDKKTFTHTHHCEDAYVAYKTDAYDRTEDDMTSLQRAFDNLIDACEWDIQSFVQQVLADEE